MAQLIIRQLDDSVMARLRERATASGRSLEDEVRTILAAACADSTVIIARLRKRLAAYRGRRFTDSRDIVRRMRDERATRL